MTVRPTDRCLGLAVAAALMAAPAQAQDVISPDPNDWGAASDIRLTISSPEFHLFQGTEGPFIPVTGMRTCASVAPAFCGWRAGVHLPAGASIRAVRWAACDQDPVGTVSFELVRAPKPAGMSVPLTGGGNTGATPGCATFTETLVDPHTVDNANNVYLVDFYAPSGAELRFVSATIVYRLQVSAPPATATFGDVPTTHAFFRFVEALAASGITGGCGGGNYCPDAALTRGQMAVFLATALGLHFPN